VVATGGGLPIKEENHALLKELGRVYYLKVSPETVYERLKGDTTRPLLQGPDPRKKIEQLLAERAPLYEKCADVIIDVSGKTFEEIIEEIMQKERGR
jgi:shikimate kinase